MFNRCWGDIHVQTVVHVALKKTTEARRGLLFVKLQLKHLFKMWWYFWKSCVHLARLVPATVQMRGRSRGRAENVCLLGFFLFFILKHKLICEGLERALLRMHRSMLTLCICGILCLSMHGSGSGGLGGGGWGTFHCLCDLTSQNQRTKKNLL